VALEMDLLPTLNNFQLEEKFKADFENNKKNLYIPYYLYYYSAINHIS